jgi:Raf kinase inhibitor-like YbhB/YbcL family protein
MKRTFRPAYLFPVMVTLILGLACVSVASGAELKVKVAGLDAGGKLPPDAAYCASEGTPDKAHDISPAVSWSRGPKGVKSYVLIMTDLDVPKDLSLVNKPGVSIAMDEPRMPFIHWVLIDIPTSITHLAKGAEGDAFAPKGKPLGPTPHGIRGANVYSHFYPDGAPLAGPRGGYDGPCPPMNDPKPHRYVTTVYALDIETLNLGGVFYGEAALEKMKGHILAQGQAEAVYGGQP